VSQTNKQIAANQRRSLTVIQNKIETLAEGWADVDAFFEGKLYELAAKVGDMRDELTDVPETTSED